MGAGQPIIGGTPTAAGEYPAVGALLYDLGGPLQVGCTGALIAPDVVLTAAHCLDPIATQGNLPVAFTLVHDARASTEPSIALTRLVPHERFDVFGTGGDEYFDIGLAFLATPVTGVEPLWMPTPDDAGQLRAGLPLALVGYGQTSETDPGSVGVKYDAMSSLIELQRTEMRVSMGAPDPQNCRGDSGGPAIATLDGVPRTVGVVSRAYASNFCDNGSLDTRVDRYLRWIDDQAGEAVPCGSGLACYDDGGCCSTGAADPGSLVLALAVAALVVRRRRR